MSEDLGGIDPREWPPIADADGWTTELFEEVLADSRISAAELRDRAAELRRRAREGASGGEREARLAMADRYAAAALERD